MGDQERIELIRGAWEAQNRRDLDGILKAYTPDVEVRTAAGGPVEGAIWHGLEAAKENYTDLWETWERFEGEPEQFLYIGDHMLVIARVETVARESRIELVQRVYQILSFEENRVQRHYSFFDARQALEEMARLV